MLCQTLIKPSAASHGHGGGGDHGHSAAASGVKHVDHGHGGADHGHGGAAAGGGHGHEGGHGHGHGKYHGLGHVGNKKIPIVDRQAAWGHGMTLGEIHWHKEMNYRKVPAGWSAYRYPQMDPYAPWQMGLPMRHVEMKLPGFWFGAGHFSWHVYSNFSKFRKAAFMWAPAYFVATVNWMRRNFENGWQVRNKSAVGSESALGR